MAGWLFLYVMQWQQVGSGKCFVLTQFVYFVLSGAFAQVLPHFFVIAWDF